MPTTAASLLGRRRHRCVLNCRRRSGRSFRRAGLLRLDAEESVEESATEFPSASEIHENVDGIVGAHENLRRGVEEISCGALFGGVCQKCSVGVTEHVDVDRNTKHEEQNANANQHHCR